MTLIVLGQPVTQGPPALTLGDLERGDFFLMDKDGPLYQCSGTSGPDRVLYRKFPLDDVLSSHPHCTIFAKVKRLVVTPFI